MAATSNQLAELFFEHRGKAIDKLEHYFAIYSRELAPFVASQLPVRLLEIGVQNGGSLELWPKYLPEGTEVREVSLSRARSPHSWRMPQTVPSSQTRWVIGGLT